MAQVRTQQNFAPLYFCRHLVLWGGEITWANSECRDAFKNTLRTARGSMNKKLTFLLCRFLMFLVRVLLLWDCLFWLGIPLYSQIVAPIYAILTEIFMKSTSTWYMYSTGSSWGDLPNAHEKNGWLHTFQGGKAVHPGVAQVTPLMIGKLLRNPPINLQTGLKYILKTDLLPEILCNN